MNASVKKENAARKCQQWADDVARGRGQYLVAYAAAWSSVCSSVRLWCLIASGQQQHLQSGAHIAYQIAALIFAPRSWRA